jgi:excinuclease ABC subunit C
VGAIRQALEVIKRLYTVRSCRYDQPTERPDRPCLDYHIGRCHAPCVGLQTSEDYGKMVGEILEILGGRVSHVRARVAADMQRSAETLEFERASTLRDVLNGLDGLERRQRALDVRGGDTDVIGIARDGDTSCAVLLRIRDGKLLGREVDFFENLGDVSDSEMVATATTRFYFGRGEHGTTDLPREVMLPLDFEDRPTVEELLTAAASRRVATHVPARGDKLRLIELANQNARHLLEERAVLGQFIEERADDVLYDLQEALALKVVPRLIACFDISHTQGTEVVGSAVVFRNGEPDKSEYRRFRIKGDWGNDDFRSMQEVVGRYLTRRIASAEPIPELILIDGGKGQLNAAVSAARIAGATAAVFASLAKREEDVYVVGRPEPLRLPRSSPALRLLQRIRNEAHRFAHGYNRKLRGKRILVSELSTIPGIGPARQRALLARFGSVRALRDATAQDIASLPGFSGKLAEQVIQALRPTP